MTQLLPRRRVISHAELARVAPGSIPLIAAFDLPRPKGGGAPGGGAGGKSDSEESSEGDVEQAAVPAADLSLAALAAGRQRLEDVLAFFSSYKKADPSNDSEPSPVSFAFDSRFLDARGALAVVAQGYRHWCALVRSAVRAAQAAADEDALGRARERVVQCRRVLRQRRLPEEARELPLPDGVWV